MFSVVIDATTVSHATTIKGGSREQNTGSSEGGTLLWVYGTGFAQNAFSEVPSKNTSNSVKLTKGDNTYDCQMHIEKVTDTQLTCYTPALPPGQYIVRVYVEGNLIDLSQHTYPNSATFRSTQSNAPRITQILPQAGLPQRLIRLYGYFKSKCYLREFDGCSGSDVPVISRIYVGGQLCNLIDPDGGVYYSNLNSTQLTCRFESNEVGIFNVTMLVTNEYGRSSVDASLFRMSSTGQLYNFETYAVIANISSSNGSVEGGTILTINGNYFCASNRYPLIVNIDDQPCTILSSNLTTIQCQTSAMPANNRSYFHGGRGLHVYYQSGFIDLNNLGNSSPPLPGINATRMWIHEASFSSQFPSPTTVWLIGFLRVPITTKFIFRLETGSYAALYLSTDENPDNKIKIVSNLFPESSGILLQNDTNYYILCIGSNYGGAFSLNIKAAMRQYKSSTPSSSLGTHEIQQITVGANATSEYQRIVYMTNMSIDGVSEVQDVDAVFEMFQIGFEGVYTALLDGPPEATVVQDALNDLPTIFPLSVTVTLVHSAYRVTFPVEMGDVSLLTVISTAFERPQTAAEIVQGIASRSKIAFRLNGATTSYLDFEANAVTESTLRSEFMNLFNIRCPPSLNNRHATPSIVHVNEFEVSNSFNETFNIEDQAFCGRSALTSSRQCLVCENTFIADYFCFAYKITTGNLIFLNYLVQSDDNQPVFERISLNINSDSRWHYKCINLRDTLESYSFTYLSVTSFLIIQVKLDNVVPPMIMIDTVTLRTSLPTGYEEDSIILSTDQSSSGVCSFPFFYNNQNHSSCILDADAMPICGLTSNVTYYCQNSSIEGVRRLYPKYQLLYNSFSITFLMSNRTIDISFRYTSCMSPSLIEVLPSITGQVISIVNASKPVDGYYSIMFDGKVHFPIPAKITGSNLANLLQSFSDFGYVAVARTGECAQYTYRIEWLANDEQPLISIANSSEVRPINAPIIVSSIRRGNAINEFYNVPNDILRTYHTTPQVEVLVGGYSSWCAKENNNCEFLWSIDHTPTITSVVQNGALVTIFGTGFSNEFSANIITIGKNGSCNIVSANTTSIICTIVNAPSGPQILQLNIVEKGLASSNDIVIVNVPLLITSFDPTGGDVGGGYQLAIIGSGFSPNAFITIGESFCRNLTVFNFSSIQCTVPPTGSMTLIRVAVIVIDGFNIASASGQFTYNVTNTPIIYNISPTFVTMLGGLLNISGTGFGNDSISVFVATTSVRVLASSNNYILVNLSALPPGLYPVTVRTSMGFARPIFHIEYRFYVQEVSPQIGSAYGGTDVYVYGGGFANGTRIQLRDQSNRSFPCNIISIQSNRIHCQTTSNSLQVTVTSNGFHPTYGFGYAWYPTRETVRQGTIVTWYWSSPELSTPVYYKIQQVANAYSTEPIPYGFDSGSSTSVGSFSYQFDSLGTFYYWAPNIDQSTGYSMRGVIDVVALEPEIMTVETILNNFTGKIQ
ncbi:unnamed protein product [Rotaria magnacalcarata]